MLRITVQYPIFVEVPTTPVEWGLNLNKPGVYDCLDRLVTALKQAFSTPDRKESWAIMKKALKKDEKYIISMIETAGIIQELMCVHHPAWLKT